MKNMNVTHGENLRKKFELISTNDKLMSDKAQIAKEMGEIKKNETYKHFPFTNGEKVEAERKMLNDIQRDEAKRKYEMIL